MSAITSSQNYTIPSTQGEARMPFFEQLFMLTWRCLVILFRQYTWIFPIFLGTFFMVVYEGSLSGAANFFLSGQSYIGFILPLSVITTALSASGAAGDIIIRDSQSGYFDKLMLTPVNRPALLLAPMIASAIMLVFEMLPLIIIAVLMGLRPETGIWGFIVLLGFGLLMGMALAGFIVGIALRTNSAALTAGATFLVFPLTYLTATFTPLDMLTGWIKTAAQINPITYILEATRGVLNTGWEPELILRALIICVVTCCITFTFAYTGLRVRVRRR